MKFSDWIRGKYIKWREDKIGNSSSVVEFARQFGASQQVMSEWMKPGGRVPTSKKYVNAILEKYPDDPDVYKVLGLVEPDAEVLARFDQLSTEDRAAFEAAGFPMKTAEDFERMTTTLLSRGINMTRKR